MRQSRTCPNVFTNQERDRDAHLGSALQAQFTLVAHRNSLEVLVRHLNQFRDDQERHAKLPHLSHDLERPYLDTRALGFILRSRCPDLLNELGVCDNRFRLVIATIVERNQLLETRVLAYLGQHWEGGTEPDPDDWRLLRLKTTTDNVYMAVDDALEMNKQCFEKLRRFIKDAFPKSRPLRIRMSEAPQSAMDNNNPTSDAEFYWAWLQHADHLFTSRSFFFLLAETVLLATTATFITDDSTLLVVLSMCLLGLAITGAWCGVAYVYVTCTHKFIDGKLLRGGPEEQPLEPRWAEYATKRGALRLLGLKVPRIEIMMGFVLPIGLILIWLMLAAWRIILSTTSLGDGSSTATVLLGMWA